MVRVLLIVLMFFSLFWIALQTPAQDNKPVKKYFIAIFSRGTAWDPSKQANEQTGFKEHSENLRRLRSEKRIPIGGRYSEKGLVILEAKNEEEARSLFASDLMVAKKTFELELHEFRPFYKGTIE